jgi:hypothetical protein
MPTRPTHLSHIPTSFPWSIAGIGLHRLLESAPTIADSELDQAVDWLTDWFGCQNQQQQLPRILNCIKNWTGLIHSGARISSSNYNRLWIESRIGLDWFILGPESAAATTTNSELNQELDLGQLIFWCHNKQPCRISSNADYDSRNWTGLNILVSESATT